MSAIANATAGIQASLQRFEASADRVARERADDSKAVDQAKEATERATEATAVAANAAVARTANRMTGRLINISV